MSTTIEVYVVTPEGAEILSNRWVDTTPADAVTILAEVLEVAHQEGQHLRVRVTGDTTAASGRHHPLAPGTAGDPRR